MAKRWLYQILVTCLALILTACSGGVDDLQAQQARDRKAIELLYSGVQGTWSGTVSNPSSGLGSAKAELTIYMMYENVGMNPDGTAKLTPVLRGKFQATEFVSETDTITLAGAYDRSGRLSLAGQAQQAKSESAPPASPLSISGFAGSGRMNVDITREDGVWGRFEATRTSSEASAPTAGKQADYRERFFRIVGPLEGVYRGRMESVHGNDYYVEISLVVVERIIDGGSQPVLSAQYRWFDPGGIAEFTLSVDYDSQFREIRMRDQLSSSPTEAPPLGSATRPVLSVAGKVLTVGGVQQLDVTVRDRSTVLGKLKAVRTASGSTPLPGFI